MKAAITLFMIAGVSYLFAAAAIALNQRNLIYYPTARYPHALQTEYIANEGESIELIVFGEANRDAIIYFGGNGESVTHSSPPMASVLADHAVYFVNYRGYSGSTGSPTEAGLYSDALAIYDTLAGRHDRISLIGRSLGSAIATYVAALRKIEKLALVTPFDSIEKIAKDQLPIFPVSLLLKDKYRSSDRAGKIQSKTLAIIAENDAVIPRKYSINLINAFPNGTVHTTEIPNSGHNTISNSRLYYAAISEFMGSPQL